MRPSHTLTWAPLLLFKKSFTMWNIFKLLGSSCCWQWPETSRKLIGTVFSYSGQLANGVYLSSYTQRKYLVSKRLVNRIHAAIHMQNTTVQKSGIFHTFKWICFWMSCEHKPNFLLFCPTWLQNWLMWKFARWHCVFYCFHSSYLGMFCYYHFGKGILRFTFSH